MHHNDVLFLHQNETLMFLSEALDSLNMNTSIQWIENPHFYPLSCLTGSLWAILMSLSETFFLEIMRQLIIWCQQIVFFPRIEEVDNAYIIVSHVSHRTKIEEQYL